MQVEKTNLEGLLVISPQSFEDERGFFMESYNEDKYKTFGITEKFVQDNISLSHKGVIRGLHFQKEPYSQGKLVSVLRGKVLDVAVDIRPHSPTFGKYVAVELSFENKKQFFIPSGFAHGFVALEEDTLLLYKCTNLYNKDSESGILWSDEELAINWGKGEKIVSEKDKVLGTFKMYKELLGIK